MLARQESKSYRKDEFLKTWLPKLSAANNFLLATIGEIRLALQSNARWGVSETCEFVCRQAKLEKVSKLKGSAWQRTMMYCWQIEPWLTTNLDRLREKDDNDGPIVREIIGSPYGAKEQCVQSAMRERTQTIESKQMETLLLKLSGSTSEALSIADDSKKGGRPRRRDEIKQQVSDAMRRMEKFILQRNQLPRSVRKSRERLFVALRQSGFSDAEIEAGLSAPNALVAARHFVSNATGLSFDTVAEYHRD
jgi:hypothetical protein